jgi:hypothetical protein
MVPKNIKIKIKDKNIACKILGYHGHSRRRGDPPPLWRLKTEISSLAQESRNVICRPEVGLDSNEGKWEGMHMAVNVSGKCEGRMVQKTKEDTAPK